MFLCLVGGFGCSEAKDPAGTISGKVTLKGSPFNNCKVAIYSSESKKTLGARIDSEGSFQFVDVAPGDYVVMVLPPPLEDDLEVAKIPVPNKLKSRDTTDLSVTVAVNENSELNIELSP